MEDLAGTAVRVTRERHLADEWAVVLAAGSIPHRPRGTRGWVGQPASVRLGALCYDDWPGNRAEIRCRRRPRRAALRHVQRLTVRSGVGVARLNRKRRIAMSAVPGTRCRP